MFIVRRSNHIQEDISRNWSSWNYGQEGISCTEEQLEAWKEQAINDDTIPFCISGFELFGQQVADADIRELYTGYWVLADLARGEGLSCNILEAETFEEALAIVTAEGFAVRMEEGDTVDCSNAVVRWFNGDDTYLLEV